MKKLANTPFSICFTVCGLVNEFEVDGDYTYADNSRCL